VGRRRALAQLADPQPALGGPGPGSAAQRNRRRRGADFLRLRGVELLGSAQIVGEVPRRGEPADTLTGPERLYADKYMGGGGFRYDGRHGGLRLSPEKIVSWDFTKLRPGR
jgi:hypothetical protein